MKKILSTTLFIMLLGTLGFAAPIDKTIKSSGINRDGISISVKNIDNGKVVYKLNEKRPASPASNQKIITLSATLDTLGEDYNYSTKLFKNNKNELYLQLGADPYFTTDDLNKLFKEASQKGITEPKAIYIDDTIFDSIEWSKHWSWGDDLLESMPRISAYNIDNNRIKIIITPTQKGEPANIYIEEPYPVISYINLVVTGRKLKSVRFSRNFDISPEIINIEGVIDSQVEKLIPIIHPKRYFIVKLENALKNAKINYYGNIENKEIIHPEDFELISEINHPLSIAIDDILKNSNNLALESSYKIAGGKFTNDRGTIKNSQKMLNAFFEKYQINAEDTQFVDGCGVSKYNLVTTDFMTDFLIKSPTKKILMEHLPAPGEGTLHDRMLYFKNNLRAKTGSLDDLANLTGYITTKHGKTYAFSIIINDPKSNYAEKKSLHEYIVRTIYEKY